MTGIVNTIQAIVRDEMRAIRLVELGVVTEVFPHSDSGDSDNYACDVKLKNSELLLRRVPISTDRIGTAAAPNVGDLVLLAFEDGDINQPIVIGRLYNDEDRPPLNRTDEVIFRLPLAKPDDESVLASIRNRDDESPARQVELQMLPKVTVRMDDSIVHAEAGSNELTMDQSRDSGGTVTVLAGRTKITLNQDGDLTVEAAGNMALKAAGDLSIDARNVSIKAQLKAEVEGGTEALVKGGVSAKLSGGASTTVQGATVSIKGVSSFSP